MLPLPLALSLVSDSQPQWLNLRLHLSKSQICFEGLKLTSCEWLSSSSYIVDIVYYYFYLFFDSDTVICQLFFVTLLALFMNRRVGREE